MIYFFIGAKHIRAYVYNIYEKFLSFIGENGIGIEAPPKKNIKNQTLKSKLDKNKKEVHFNVVPKETENINKIKMKDLDIRSTTDKRKIRIEKPVIPDYDAKSTYQEIIKFRE